MLITTTKEFFAFYRKLEAEPLFVCDLETNGLLWYHRDHPIGMAFLLPSTGESFYIAVRHETGRNYDKLARRYLRRIFADPKRYWLNYNTLFDAHMLQHDGYDVQCQVMDCMTACHLNNENELTFKLKMLSDKYLAKDSSKQMHDIDDLLKERKLGKGHMAKLPLALVAEYAEQDVKLTWKLTQLMQACLKRQGLLDIWHEVNTYSRAIFDMEEHGLLVNRAQCEANLTRATAMVEKLQSEIRAIVGIGDAFNPNSPAQVQKVIQLPSSDKEHLERSDHPIAELMLQYRGWKRACTNYFQKFMDEMTGDNHMHAGINMIGTVSGRMSCFLHTLPKENDTYHVRGLIEAAPGMVLMAADYSQIEIRIMGHYSKDPFLLRAYAENADLHQRTADRLKISRQMGKVCNLSLQYGMGSDLLAKKLKVGKPRAAQIHAGYHRMIPGLRALGRKMEETAQRQHYIEMFTGRRRHFRKFDAFKDAANNLVQGSVAEIMRLTITRLHRELQGTGVTMILQVHDEIIFEGTEEVCLREAPKIKAIMEDFQFLVPIVAEFKIGPTWGSMKGF